MARGTVRATDPEWQLSRRRARPDLSSRARTPAGGCSSCWADTIYLCFPMSQKALRTFIAQSFSGSSDNFIGHWVSPLV